MPSTAIEKLMYDPATATLLVTYTSGARYVYMDVPEKVFKHLQAAPSRGRYLNLHIKGKYAFEKMP